MRLGTESSISVPENRVAVRNRASSLKPIFILLIRGNGQASNPGRRSRVPQPYHVGSQIESPGCRFSSYPNRGNGCASQSHPTVTVAIPSCPTVMLSYFETGEDDNLSDLRENRANAGRLLISEERSRSMSNGPEKPGQARVRRPLKLRSGGIVPPSHSKWAALPDLLATKR